MANYIIMGTSDNAFDYVPMQFSPSFKRLYYWTYHRSITTFSTSAKAYRAISKDMKTRNKHGLTPFKFKVMPVSDKPI